ncbi:MAG TPA: NAD(P)-dependent alcohol dehydrogenase [Terriglobia bacterium]|nr:NAD(P)-dependent alcohol dehydrogenase [Terriglobia bacterium]
MHVRALSVDSRKALLVPESISLEDLRDDEILVRITHCGLCRSDLNRLRLEKPTSGSRMVLGHEIVGEVVRTGRAVRGMHPGIRVGVGWQSGSCGDCEWCMKGEQHLCLDQEETCIGRSGGFATHIKVQSGFAVPVPSELDSAEAAPLMCAGITVFSPIVRHGVNEEKRAAVNGIGGLGHLALQFLRAMGNSPDAFSSSSDKEEDAGSFGAGRFFRMEGIRTAEQMASVYDFILSTSPGLSDLTGLVRMLRPRGVLCLVGLPRTQVTFAADELIGFQKTIEGSPIGSPGAIAEMFRVAVDKRVRPKIECFPMTQANAAMERLAENRIRYRAVLVQDLA